ncbi:hypothetical protein B0F90DRAFT_1811956 [Multifurca ochricompacta]|uniref:2,4-dienoyl-CoA reductase [(3E)-enoyl-CoA-producing] n=1 Tax=Multifurca ochricompacta TaxID=376703 RepID=A0AAD4QJL2_9AGAM|nr:hypothetical protein B0F90DRAFT_1811956 [Multifurca ochricompacta]
MSPSRKAHVLPVVDSTAVFKDDIFKGKVLFCTGGGSGICRVMTQAVMRHGASAAIVGRKARLSIAAKELSEATGSACIALKADVRDPKQVQTAVQRTIEKYGRIDFVINGAAGNFLAPISGLSENGFRTVIEIDTLGTYHVIKATLPHVQASRDPTSTSLTMSCIGTPYQVHVSAAKAAVDALSAVLAVEQGPHGVRSNVIAPGPIAGTEGVDRLSPKGPGSDENYWPVPTGRKGESQDVANAAVFLFSDAASFISGQVLVVDGASEHLRAAALPYPQSVLDPASVQHLIKARL